MKFLTKPWPKEYDGILYFFQRLEEMLFHYSEDIVRVPIHNTRTLIKEYLDSCNGCREGKIKAYQCDKILEELRHSLKCDKILRTNFGDTFVQDIERKMSQDKIDVVQYLNNKLPQKTYFIWCVEYIKEHALHETHKDEIELGLKAWIVELISHGYSPEYIYTYLHSDKMGNNSASPVDVLNGFLGHFTLRKKTFRVYFAFNPILIEYKNLLEKRLHLDFSDDDFGQDIKKNRNDFVGFLDIEAIDPYLAISGAYHKLTVFIRYYQVISNGRRQLVRETGKVVIPDTIDYLYLPVRSTRFHSIEISSRIDLEEHIDFTIMRCQSKSNPYTQLNKMVDLHNTAIAQKDLDNGFLNLWSIMELFSSDMQNDLTISKVTSAVIPILKKDYFQTVLGNIAQDLEENLSRKDYTELIEALGEPEHDILKIARFVFLPEYEDLRERYFEKLERYPVIRAKILRLYNIKDTKTEINKMSQKYAQRVEWHLYRLYRTRNAIVHSGNSHSRIQFLGEHLHIYVDNILNELLYKLSVEETLKTISDVIVDAKLASEKIFRTFDGKGAVSASDLEVLFDDYYYIS